MTIPNTPDDEEPLYIGGYDPAYEWLNVTTLGDARPTFIRGGLRIAPDTYPNLRNWLVEKRHELAKQVDEIDRILNDGL